MTRSSARPAARYSQTDGVQSAGRTLDAVIEAALAQVPDAVLPGGRLERPQAHQQQASDHR